MQGTAEDAVSIKGNGGNFQKEYMFIDMQVIKLKLIDFLIIPK